MTFDQNNGIFCLALQLLRWSICQCCRLFSQWTPLSTVHAVKIKIRRFSSLSTWWSEILIVGKERQRAILVLRGSLLQILDSPEHIEVVYTITVHFSI